MLNNEHASFHELSCLVSKIDDSWLWHRRAAHINMHHLNHLVKNDLVIDIPKLKLNAKKDDTVLTATGIKIQRGIPKNDKQIHL